jgi:hypothetical protein
VNEITINQDTFLGYHVQNIYLDGQRQACCIEAQISPKSFAEPTEGKLLVYDGDDSQLIYREAGLREGEVERDGLACKWVTGLVRAELNSITCPACGVKDSIKFNEGIEKVWCLNCGVDASKIEFGVRQ